MFRMNIQEDVLLIMNKLYKISVNMFETTANSPPDKWPADSIWRKNIHAARISLFSEAARTAGATIAHADPVTRFCL